MKILLPFLGCLLAMLPAAAQTNVSGGIYNNVTWTTAGSPYRLTGDIVVFEGASLVVEEGVEIAATRDVRLEVRGNMSVRGTQAHPVIIHGDQDTPTPAYWRGIIFTGTTNPLGIGNQAGFNWCHISDAHTCIDLDLAYHGPYTFRNCTFSNNTYVNNDGGMGGTTFDHCDILNNYTGFRYFQFGGMISNCRFDGNEYGVDGADSLVNCTFTNHSGIAMQPYGYTANCTVTGNNIGVSAAFNSVNSRFEHNRITDNNTGLVIRSYFDGSITFTDNQLCNNRDYNLVLNTANNCSIPYNCWCSTDSAAIRRKIYDGYRDIQQGLVRFFPVSAGCSTLGFSSPAPAGFTLYPNPAGSGTTVYLKPAGPLPGQDRIAVTDALGRLVVRVQGTAVAGGLVALTLPAGLAPGNYFVTVAGGQRMTQPLTIR